MDATDFLMEMKASKFARKLQEVFGEDDAAIESAIKEAALHVKQNAKLLGDDFATNFVLWQKDVGEAVANQLKDNPAIMQIVEKWTEECKEFNTRLTVDAFWNLVPEDKREGVERLDADCFVTINIFDKMGN